MIVAGAALSIRDARLEGAVVSLIREWATAHPDELVLLDQQVKGMRHEREHMGKHMARAAEVPRTLWTSMAAAFGRLWHDDARLKRLFYQHFRVGLLNPRSPPGDSRACS